MLELLIMLFFSILILAIIAAYILFLISLYQTFAKISEANQLCPTIIFALILIFFPLLNMIWLLPFSIKNEFPHHNDVKKIADSLILWGALSIMIFPIAAIVYWVNTKIFEKKYLTH